MKKYDEMATDVFRRIDEYETAQKRKRKTITRTVASLGCVCLVALTGFGVWQSGLLSSTPPVTLEDAVNKGEKDYYNDKNKGETPDNPGETTNESTPAGNETVSNPANSDGQTGEDSDSKHLFAINEITATIGAAFKYRDPALHYKETWDIARMADYLEVDLRNVIRVLPSGMGMKYSGTGEFTVTYENDGTLVEDRAVYEFTGNDGAKITVLASKLGTPYDCLYQTESENVTSIRLPDTGDIISVLVYAQNKSESTIDYQMYVADFACNGVYYRVTAENVAAHRLDSLIREIAK